ncbi:MAG: hypothetical protein DSZ24_00245 [Thermodesulfatator sp.]|nr:MAG: hypothetical protein DSZ24_00245 [Thermodesulfatator sp.]
MPRAIVFNAYLEKETPRHVLFGETVHGLLHEILFEGRRLEVSHHRPLKPFTTAIFDVRVPPEASAEGENLPPGTRFRLRFTFLEDFVFEIFAEKLTPRLLAPEGAFFDLSGYPVRFTEVFFTPEVSVWADELSYEEILSQARPLSRFSLYFKTPTSFARPPGPFGRSGLPFPLPERMFSGLLRRWNAFAPEPFPSRLEEALLQGFRPAIFELQSRMAFLYENGTLITFEGFVGRVTFKALKGVPEEARRWADILTRLAFFSGVGQKTTMGLGMCRRIETREQ